jgi:hypothetical protein
MIAACLLGLVFREAPIVTSVHAQDGTKARPTYVIIAGVDPELEALPVRNQVHSGIELPFLIKEKH